LPQPRAEPAVNIQIIKAIIADRGVSARQLRYRVVKQWSLKSFSAYCLAKAVREALVAP
jgi:hypothetical protein